LTKETVVAQKNFNIYGPVFQKTRQFSHKDEKRNKTGMLFIVFAISDLEIVPLAY
jgi:hypothetical protein